ncbi:unnamed protein product, partial [Arabidopsis halleri]
FHRFRENNRTSLVLRKNYDTFFTDLEKTSVRSLVKRNEGSINS